MPGKISITTNNISKHVTKKEHSSWSEPLKDKRIFLYIPIFRNHIIFPNSQQKQNTAQYHELKLSLIRQRYAEQLQMWV